MRDPREVCILEAGARRRPGKELRPMTTYDDTYFEEMAEAAERENLLPFLTLYSPGKKLGSLLWQCSKQQREHINSLE